MKNIQANTVVKLPIYQKASILIVNFINNKDFNFDPQEKHTSSLQLSIMKIDLGPE